MSQSKPELPANILVVDDDLNNLRLLTEVLSGHGYEVRPIRDGVMALAAIQAKQPDLILLDIMMPCLNGYEVCSQVKANPKTCHIPIIFLSALHETLDKVTAFSSGGVDYITKPFQVEEVIARIENQLQINRLQKQLKEQNEQLKQEIRERELMENKLQSSQAEIRGFFEAMADIVLLVDADGQTIKIAPTSPEKLYPPGTDILDQTVKQLFNEQGELCRRHIRQSLEKQQIVNCEYSLKIGREQIWFSASIAPTSENTVAWVARDISDRKKAEDQLKVLLETSQAINESPDIDSALASVLQLISCAIDWDFAEAWLPSESGNILETSCAWYSSDTNLAEFRRETEKITFAPNQGLPGRIWLSGQPEWIEDISQCEEATFLRTEIAAKVGLKAAFAIPVVAENKVLVVLVFFNRDVRTKNQRLLDLVSAMARMVSSLIVRKQAEIALRTSEERFRNLFENSPVAYQSLDEQGRYIDVNDELCQLMGYSREELLGKYFGEFWSPEMQRYFPKKFESFKSDGIICAELYLVTKDSTTVTVLMEGRVQHELNGKFVKMHCILYNITERKRVEEEIKAARERLELVLRASQDGFWDWNLSTNEIYFSPRFKEMLGYADHEFPNQLSAWKKVIFEEDYIAAVKLVEDYNSGRIPQFLATQRFHHKNGSTVYILARAIHLKDHNGVPIRMIGAHTDITNLKSAEEALQKAVLAADAANRAKSEFLASMSHELRTPLNAILGFSQIMSNDSSLSTEHQKNLTIINRAGEHLLALIDDILEVSKIEAGRTTFNENDFDLLQLLDSLEKMLQLKAASKGLQLIFQYGFGIPQYVKTDEGKLRQVLLNLLGNAIKFTRIGSVKLRVSVACLQPEISSNDSLATTTNDEQKLILYFEVEDTGPGIDPQEIHLLFEAFAQTETGRKSQQGTGLGLPISQKYVQLMGGEIQVSSTPGVGSIFAFTIQIGLTEADSVQIPKPYRKIINLAPNQPEYRILIVDDVPESRLLLIKILTAIGFFTQEAENGQEAVEIWNKWQPHLILMDMRMPVMDGYEAVRQIRMQEKQKLNCPKNQGNSAKTIIFALTASAFEEQRKIIISVGCDDFIRKPFQAEVLLEKISQYLGVEYLWEAESKEIENIQKTAEPIAAVDLLNLLSQMSSDWSQSLYDAASECSDDLVLNMVSEIPPEKAPLANTLRDLAENFQFDKIRLLVEQTWQ